MLVRKNWPLYSPVLLGLLDDSDVKHKLEGLIALRKFVQICPISVLRDCSLGAILAHAVWPSLAYLPPLTPENESAQLLEFAYPVLVELYSIDRQHGQSRTQLLTKLLRDGIFTGYRHASQHPRVVEVLLAKMSDIVGKLGLPASPHIQVGREQKARSRVSPDLRIEQYLLEIPIEVLVNTVTTDFPNCQLSAVRSLKAVMVNCWPRLVQQDHENRILGALAICWLALDDDGIEGRQSGSSQQLAAELTDAALLLSAIMSTAGDSMQEKTSSMLALHPKLGPLFSPKATV